MKSLLNATCNMKSLKFVKWFTRSFATNSILVESRTNPMLIPHNVLLHEYVFEGMMKWPQKIAMECGETGRKYTYNEIYRNSISFAGFLKESFEVDFGNTLSIILPNVPEYAIVVLGSMLANLKVSTMNPRSSIEEFQKQLRLSETKIVVTSKEAYSTIAMACEKANMCVRFITLNCEAVGAIPADTTSLLDIWKMSQGFKTQNIPSANTALIPFSSGTTGLPKAVELSHYNLVANIHQGLNSRFNLCEETTVDHQTTVAGILPFFHMYGLASVCLTHLRLGAKIVTIPKFSPHSFIRLLTDHKPGLIHLVPPLVHMISNNDEYTPVLLETLRTVVCGAAPIGKCDLQKFGKKFRKNIRIIQAYGMTEASPLITQQTEENNNDLGSVGFLLPNTTAKIIRTDECNSESLGPNESGELYIKGPQVMKGYYKNQVATMETLTKDGWLKTGDIAQYDEAGQFYIIDRIKELIKVKGHQVAPAELEELIRMHPHVEDVAVVGVPDYSYGEVPKAFVVAKKGSSLKCCEIQKYVDENVTPYKKLIGGVTQIDVIPKTPSGKIKRKLLKNM